MHWVPSGYFLNINSGAQTLLLSAHEMAPMRAFSILKKWPKIAKMTPNDLLTLEMVFSEPLRKTEENTLGFLNFILFVDLERKNKFHGNHANYES